jgi:methyltransferase OMS1
LGAQNNRFAVILSLDNVVVLVMTAAMRIIASAVATTTTCAAIGFGAAVGYGLALPPCDACGERVQGADRNAAYEREAKSFDAAVGSHEYWSGIESMRAKLIGGHARGECLEVASGTGRNLRYYDAKKVRALTALDASGNMVDVCREKVDSAHGTVVRTVVMKGDAHNLATVKSRSVDTVVDTFGLCSYDDPVRALQEMKRVCKTDGRVLLLEHGRSEYTWLNNILDSTAHAHADRWGCYWNRDITALVEKAGLEVVEKSTAHLSTTFVIVAKP